MSKEDPSINVMGISISIRELVMDSMISTPNVDTILTRNTLSDTQEDLKR